ncbi:hypothetical protein GOODEAATRI_019657 [Goodea atripinnis]|uniref:Uncharacterized protein n=1 Tax=Goodea atripinnis TaxID=208336 RepID=A0ABV0MJ72_9TELE
MGNVRSPTHVNYDMPEERIRWSTLMEKDIFTYFTQCETRLSNIELPRNAITCNDLNCHRVELCSLYDKNVDSLLISGRHLCENKKHKAGMRMWRKFMQRQEGPLKPGCNQGDPGVVLYFCI